MNNRISVAAGSGLLAMLNEAQQLPDVQIPLDYRCMVSRIRGQATTNSTITMSTITLDNLHYSFDNIPEVHAS